MVITCEGCATRFQLDDARVPAQGVRVRCSRCEHAFFAKPPQAAGDPVVRVVDEALQLDEWQFNHEQDASGAGELLDAAGQAVEEPLDAAGQAVEEPLDAAGQAVEEPLDAAGQAVEEPLDAGDLPLAPAVECDPEGFLSAGADVDDDIDVLLEGSAAITDGAPQQGAAEAEVVVAAEAEVVVAAEAEVVAVEAEVVVAEDGPGSPENWDLLAGDETPADAAPRNPVPLARIALGLPTEAPPQTRVVIADDAEPMPTRGWLGRAANGVGWTAVVGLVAMLLQGGGPSLPVGPETHAPVAGLALENFGARRLDNAVVGPIHVVEGTLRVPARGPATRGVRLAVQLLDADGAVVADDVATLGPVLSESMLREQSPAELRALLERGVWWSRRPGSTRSVMAVIDAAPADAERFRVVPVPFEAPAQLPDAAPAPLPEAVPTEEDPGA